MLLWPSKLEGVVEAVKERALRNGASPHKDSQGPVGESGAFAPDEPPRSDDVDENEDDSTPMLPPSPPVLAPEYTSMAKEPDTPVRKYDEVMNNLVATFNSRLDAEIEACADGIAEKATLRVEARLKSRKIGHDEVVGPETRLKMKRRHVTRHLTVLPSKVNVRHLLLSKWRCQLRTPLGCSSATMATKLLSIRRAGIPTSRII